MSLEDIKPKPEIIDIEGIEYKIEYDFNAFAYFENETGLSVFEAKDLLLENRMKLSHQVILLHAGMLKHQSSFNIKLIKKRYDIGYLLTKVGNSVLKAFLKPLFPPEIFEKLEGMVDNTEKKTHNQA